MNLKHVIWVALATLSYVVSAPALASSFGLMNILPGMSIYQVQDLVKQSSTATLLHFSPNQLAITGHYPGIEGKSLVTLSRDALEVESVLSVVKDKAGVAQLKQDLINFGALVVERDSQTTELALSNYVFVITTRGVGPNDTKIEISKAPRAFFEDFDTF